MDKKKFLFILSFFVVLLISVQSVKATYCEGISNEIWCEDFENGSIVHWQTTTNAEIESVWPIEENYSMNWSASGSKSPLWPSMSSAFNITMNVTLTGTGNDADGFINKMNIGQGGSAILFVWGSSDCTDTGKLCYRDGTTYTTTGVEYNTIKYIKISVYDTGSVANYDLFINGNFIANGISTSDNNDAIENINEINFGDNALSSDSQIDNILVYNGTAILSEVETSNFTITVEDEYDGSSLTNFTVNIDGQTYTTTNLSVTTHLLSNSTKLYNFNISSTQAGGYFNRTYDSYNVSVDLTAQLYQVAVDFQAYELLTNFSIPNGRFFTTNENNVTGNKLILKAGSFNITFSHGSYFNLTQEFTFSVLDNITKDFFGVYNTVVNVSATNALNSVSISSFSITTTEGNYSYSVGDSTSSGYLEVGLIQNLSYNLSITALGYASTSASLSPSTLYYEYNFTLYPFNSVLINVYNEETGSRIQTNATITFSSNFSEFTNVTTNGSLVASGLLPGIWSILINASGYSPRYYSVTVGNDSTQQIDVYIITSGQTTTFTVYDFDQTDTVLSDVLTTMYRYINGSWKPVESKYTDITGKTQFTYVSSVNYKFYFSKQGYNDNVFFLNPVLFSSYDVKISKTTLVNFTADFDQISIIFAPKYFKNNNDTTFNFIIASPSGLLLDYGYTINFPGGSVSQSGINAIGGQLTDIVSVVNATIFDTVKLDYYYTTSLSGRRNFTVLMPIMFGNNTATLFTSNREKTYGLSIFERILVITIVVLFFVGIAAMIGRIVPGLAIGLGVYGYSVYIGFVPVLAILPSFFLGMIFLYWKSGG